MTMLRYNVMLQVTLYWQYDDSVGVSWNENNTSYLNWQIAYGYSGFDVQSRRLELYHGGLRIRQE